MSYKHKIFSTSFHLLRLANYSRNFFQNKETKKLRVLVFHDIPPSRFGQFYRQLKWLKRRWTFIDLKTFCSIANGEQPLVDDCLLLTFDDGFYSNYLVAINILKKLNIKATFFVVSGFIDNMSEVDARDFISKGIRKDLEPFQMPPHWKNMSWANLRELQSCGHTIGAHTGKHLKATQLTTNNDLIREIVTSADYIETQIDSYVDSFAFTFGDILSLNKEAFEIASNRFKCVFTSLRGDNAKQKNTKMICRDTVSPDDSKWLVGAFLEGGADKLYEASRSKCYEWIKSIDTLKNKE